MKNELTPLAPIALDTLESEPHPTSLRERLGKLAGQIGPMIRCFTR
jgi:hypothetical protein